jgi:hypothetical protein
MKDKIKQIIEDIIRKKEEIRKDYELLIENFKEKY